LSSLSSYAPDKLETVNLANHNLNFNIPFVTVGGRGSASYTISLAYNSKVWTSQHDVEVITNPFPGQEEIFHHYGAAFGDNTGKTPNLVVLGGGWSILKAPVIKRALVGIKPLSVSCPNFGNPVIYGYMVTRIWLVLPDGSEIALRDDLTDGAPLVPPQTFCQDWQTDGYRGRIWHSTDGSAITYVTDVDNGVVQGNLNGWVFTADGTRYRISGGSAGRCTKIIDPNGNVLDITYNIPQSGAVTYRDQLGREVILQGGTGGATVTIKGYDVVPDRVYTITTGEIGATDGSGNPINLRSDYWSWQRPFLNGDWSLATGTHATSTPHTDLFWDNQPNPVYPQGSDSTLMMDITDVFTVTRVDLLDGRSFRFRYNPYGELAEVIYPDGGVSQLDYQPYFSVICEANSLAGWYNRGVSERRLLSDGANIDVAWTYSPAGFTQGGQTYPGTKVEVRSKPGNELLMSESHFFLMLDAEYRFCNGEGSDGTGYERFENAKEFRVERMTGSGTQKQTETRDWIQREQVSWGPIPFVGEYGQQQPPNSDRVTKQDTILENNKLSRVEYGYDIFNNVTSIIERDFGTNPNAGTVKRQTTRTYVGANNGYCYTNLNGPAGCAAAPSTNPDEIIHMRRLLESETTSDGSAVEAYTEFEYDNYVTDDNHAAIVVNSGMIGYNGSRFVPFNASFQPRGNATQRKSLISGPIDTGTYTSSYLQYDEAGNAVKAITPNAPITSTSTISYADDFGDGSNPGSGVGGTNGATFALPTMVTNSLNQVTRMQYSYARGVTTGVKDANLVVAKTEYNDPYDRPTRVTAALGLPEQSKSEMSYPTATANEARVSKQLDATRWLTSRTQFDGFGRPVLGSQSEGGLHFNNSPTYTIHTKTIYDGLGRPKFATNPYRSSSATTDGWSRTAYDIAGRVIDVATFEGGPDSTPPDYPATTGTGVVFTGNVTTTYASEVTTVADQAGKQRRSTVDGLGRLTQVDELFENGSVYATTTYAYDARGNLKTVTQDAATQAPRSFSYDGLSRLTSATNPESGTVSFQYDLASNLKKRTDARFISSNYEYDSLNRVKSRTYVGDPEGTPAVSYFYDSASLPPGAPPFTRGPSIGRLVAVLYGASGSTTGNYTGYDSLGRTAVNVQKTDSNVYQMSYGYNLAGATTSETYPSGRVIEADYDSNGRLSGVRTQNTQFYYAGGSTGFGIQYTASGAISEMRLGNGRIERAQFNSRLQPTQITLDSNTNGVDLLKLDYGYGTTANNGNLLSQTITAPNPGGGSPLVWSQSYSYDHLNRISEAKENNGASWSQQFAYDRFGNMWVPSTFGFTLSSLTPQNQYAFDAANNRFTGGTNEYDLAGNHKKDVQGRTFTYDAENRQVSFNGAVGQYFYDGDGHRVKKIDASGTTVFVYNAAGQLIAEYTTGTPTGGDTSYLTTDHLGSTRVVTDSGGNVRNRYDYLPFGGEIPAGVGGRSPLIVEGPRQKFTQKERDSESGLDYFLARYFSSAQGRFTSEDKQGFALANPQTLNGYQYGLNNPLRFVDPDGNQERDKSGAELYLRLLLEYLVPGAFKADERPPARGNPGPLPNAPKLVGEYTKTLGEGTQEIYNIISYADITGASHIAKTLLDYDQGKISEGELAINLGTFVLSTRTGGASRRLQAVINKCIGTLGEIALGKIVGGASRLLHTSLGDRIVDRLVSISGFIVANEAKTGYMRLTSEIATQIAKDAELLQTKQVNQVVWHFFANPTTGGIGAEQRVLNELTKNGIQYQIHHGVNITR
jgi:RHS repeat-associated protein